MSDEPERQESAPEPSFGMRAGAAATSLGLGILGLLPFAWVLPLLPMTRDASIWIDRSDWASPKLQEWLLETQHFNVGFRPVTGLSYLLNEMGGGGILPYRITDFGLHLAAVLLVHAVVRRWAPHRSPWAATVGAAVLAFHPMVAIVVPHLARRGYSLASGLALLGLWLLSRHHVAATLLAIACLGAGALANEAAYVAFGVATLLLTSRKRWAELAALGGGLGFLLAWRVSVIGGLGGYAAATDRAGRIGTVALATWSTLFPVGLPNREVLPSLPALVVSIGFAAAVVANAVVALRTPDDREARWPTWNRPLLWALAWLLGLTAVYLPNGVWFPRQVYMLVPPLAVFTGLLMAHGLGGRSRVHIGTRLAAAAVLVLGAARFVMVAGSQQQQITSWQQTDRVTHQLIQTARGLPKRQDVVVVLPFARRGGQASLKAREGAKRRRQDPLGTRVSWQWANRRVARRKLELAAMYLHDPFHEAPQLTVEAVPGQAGAWRLVLTDPSAHWSVGEELQNAVDGPALTVTVPDGMSFYVDDGAKGWLVRP